MYIFLAFVLSIGVVFFSYRLKHVSVKRFVAFVGSLFMIWVCVAIATINALLAGVFEAGAMLFLLLLVAGAFMVGVVIAAWDELYAHLQTARTQLTFNPDGRINFDDQL